MIKKPTNPQSLYETGIGRPVSAEWVSDFSETFRRVSPRAVRLVLRKIPGLIYLTGDNLHSRGVGGPPSSSQDERQPLIERYVDSLTQTLYTQGTLDTSVVESDLALGLYTPGPVVIKRANRGADIGVRVYDLPSEVVDQQYLIDTEKQAYENLFGIPRAEISTKEHPRHYLKLGKLIGTLESGIGQRVAAEMGDQTVPFSGVGIVRLDSVED